MQILNSDNLLQYVVGDDHDTFPTFFLQNWPDLIGLEIKFMFHQAFFQTCAEQVMLLKAKLGAAASEATTRLTHSVAVMPGGVSVCGCATADERLPGTSKCSLFLLFISMLWKAGEEAESKPTSNRSGHADGLLLLFGFYVGEEGDSFISPGPFLNHLFHLRPKQVNEQ